MLIAPAAAEIAQQEPVLTSKRYAQKKHGWQYLNKRGEVGESGLRIDEAGVATKPARRVERVDAEELVDEAAGDAIIAARPLLRSTLSLYALTSGRRRSAPNVANLSARSSSGLGPGSIFAHHGPEPVRLQTTGGPRSPSRTQRDRMICSQPKLGWPRARR